MINENLLKLIEDLEKEVNQLQSAIRRHRDEKGHDRCWLDDQELYKVLPEGLSGVDQQLPSEEEFLGNCKNYFDHRQDPNVCFIRQRDVVSLIPLDMKKAVGNNHPDIDEKKSYLCLVGGEWFAGQFSKEWYGWNFLGWVNPIGFQFDAPGTNASKWQKIWEIKTGFTKNGFSDNLKAGLKKRVK